MLDRVAPLVTDPPCFLSPPWQNIPIWEDIYIQNSEQIHVINLYSVAFDRGILGLFRVLWVVSMSR